MRGPRYDRILAGTALALVLALAPSAYAQPDRLEANMPQLEQGTLPPPTGADGTGAAGEPPPPAPRPRCARAPRRHRPAQPRGCAERKRDAAGTPARSAGIARSRRPADRRDDARPPRREGPPDLPQP